MYYYNIGILISDICEMCPRDILGSTAAYKFLMEMSPNLLLHDVSDDIMHSWNAFGPNVYVTNVNPGRPSQMSWSYIICIIQTLMLILFCVDQASHLTNMDI